MAYKPTLAFENIQLDDAVDFMPASSQDSLSREERAEAMEPDPKMDEMPMPSTLDEVERLILDLYQPGPPRKIARIQETLQKLQKSAEGWHLASSLLDSSDEKVKFFGALTFTVKLNSDSESLGHLDAKALLGRLIDSLIHCLDHVGGTLVIRKLCSTLVVYFLRFSSSWPKCVKHLVQSLCLGEAAPIELLDQAPDTTTLAGKLTAEKASAALWFSTALAEEVAKIDSNHIKHHKLHELLHLNAVDVVGLIARFLEGKHQTGLAQSKVRQEAMKCFQSWVLYSHRALVDVGLTLYPLKSLTKPAIACLVQNDMYGVTIELFSDVLANYSRFLNEEDFHLLFTLFNSRWSIERYSRLVQGDFEFESLQYGQFMLGFGDAKVQDLARNTDAASQQFLKALAGLLAAKGHAVAEDRIFVPALEFWSTFVEVMIDALYSTEEQRSLVNVTTENNHNNDGLEIFKNGSKQVTQSWFPTARSYMMQAIECCWHKIQFPPSQIFEDWDSVDRIGFTDARKDVADLLQSSYTVAGVLLFSLFAKMTLQSLGNGAWAELEASLFCLGALADCVDGDDCDGVLEDIFGSTLFGILANEGTQVPVRPRQTALFLIGQYNSYFERRTEYLPSALTFLFKALKTPALAGTASRSIHSLCSSCRGALTKDLDTFLQQYGEFDTNHNTEPLVKERIIGAIAAIIQSMATEEGRKGPVTQLVRFVEGDFKRCINFEAMGNSEEAEAVGLEALRCLASIARGLQAPGDVPVDLENVGNAGIKTNFWISGQGAPIQRYIQNMIEKLIATKPYSGDMVEAACSIYRAGFTEMLPGPFVFSPDSVSDFLVRTTIGAPRLGAIISTACSLVSSYTAEPLGHIDDALRKLIKWLFGILKDLELPANDPEIAQTSIDFFYRLLPAYIHILLEQPSLLLEKLFMFTLRALTGRDPLPKFAAADFWSHFVLLANLAPPLQATVNGVMEHLGPPLAEALIYNISGHASRSELDKISEPLKKMVVKQVRSKSWLEDALFRKTLLSDGANEDDRRIFLQKVIMLRGARQTNQVVKDFWLVCRGSNFAYAS